VPAQKFSQGFKDISLSFKKHPVTRDILTLKNEDAIKRSVQNLVRIIRGEVFFNELLGTRISGSLFELANSDYVDQMKTEIETVIKNFEPRIKNLDVDFNSFPDQNAVEVIINYEIVGLSAPTQSVNFILEPTRL
jgi:phage baseplate assembly protein W